MPLNTTRRVGTNWTTLLESLQIERRGENSFSDAGRFEGSPATARSCPVQ